MTKDMPTPERIFDTMNAFQRTSEIHRATGLPQSVIQSFK